jgi:hypothetical protein
MQWLHFPDPTRMFTQGELDKYVSENSEVDCITSHQFRVFPPVIAGRPALYLTFLREPADYLISLARHWIRDRAELGPDFREHLPTDFDKMDVVALLNYFIDGAKRKANPEHLFGAEMTLMFFEETVKLLGLNQDEIKPSPADEGWYRHLARAIAITQLNQFFFVGDFATFAGDVRILVEKFKKLGISADNREIPWERRSTDSPFASAAQEEEFRQIIPILFPVDRDVYDHFRQRHTP